MIRKIFLLLISYLTLFAFSETTNFPNSTIKNKLNGNVSETLMHDYFKKSGWTPLKGEVGSAGIDGLYIKKKDGVVSKVLFVESKYNKSQLTKTIDGSRQMSKQWLSNKVDNLIKDAQKKGNLKELKEYKQILKHIEQDTYKARLWKLIPKGDGKYLFEVKKVIASGLQDIKVERLTGIHKYKIDQNIIDTKNPKSTYEKSNAQNIKKHVLHERRKIFSKGTKKILVKSVLKGALRGSLKNSTKYIPYLGIAMQIADDIRIEYKLSDLETTTKTNNSNIAINAENIDKNLMHITDLETTTKTNQLLLANLESRINQEHQILEESIDENRENILDIYASMKEIDTRIIHFSQDLVSVNMTIDKNTKEIESIKDGILKTGIDELEKYYDTNNTDHLNNAYHDFKKSINIETGDLKPIEYIYYLIALAELQDTNRQKEYLSEINKYYHKLITLAKKDHTFLPLVNASYIIIQEFDTKENQDFSSPLLSIYENLIQKEHDKNDFDGAYRLAKQVHSYVNSSISARLLESALQKREKNYQESRNFSSKYDLLSKVEKYHNELLLKDASRYLYNHNYYDDLLILLQEHTLQDNEFKLKVYLSLYKQKDVKKHQQLKALILSNMTYTEELKTYATSH